MSWWALAAAAADAVARSQSAKDANEQNTQLQREFATMGIRWKVADAQAAGIHPLYALGASTHMPSIAVQPEYQGGLAEMGQEISRAQAATASAEERRNVQAAASEQQRLMNQSMARREDREDARLASQLQTDEVQRQYLQSQIARLKADQIGPPMPDGATPRPVRTGNIPAMGAIQVEPSKVTSSDPSEPGREAGVTPGMKRYRLGGGLEIDLPGQQASESLESIPGGGLGAMALHAYGRWVYGHNKPSDKLLPKGYEWKWNWFRQAWNPEPIKR